MAAQSETYVQTTFSQYTESVIFGIAMSCKPVLTTHTVGIGASGSSWIRNSIAFTTVSCVVLVTIVGDSTWRANSTPKYAISVRCRAHCDCGPSNGHVRIRALHPLQS
jgi:hypothetical protein